MTIQIVRSEATATICSNLIWAGLLLPQEVAHYVAELGGLSDTDLSLALCFSRKLLNSYLQTYWSVN